MTSRSYYTIRIRWSNQAPPHPLSIVAISSLTHLTEAIDIRWQGTSSIKDHRLQHNLLLTSPNPDAKACLLHRSTRENWQNWNSLSGSPLPLQISYPLTLPEVSRHLTISLCKGSKRKDIWSPSLRPWQETTTFNNPSIVSQMQFMQDISRSVTVTCQHPLEKFLHLLTSLVLMC